MSQDGAAFFDAVNAYIVADVRGDVEPLDELEPVTARLISVAIGPHPLYAAAPELLAALRELLAAAEASVTSDDDVASMLRYGKAVEDCHAAIAKAEGR